MKQADYSQRISERQWNLPDKGELESRREATYTFMPDELKRILENKGVKNVSLSGPGAYGRTVPREILVKIMNDPEQKSAFLDFCYEYDSNPYVCGMGKDNLFAMGEI